MRHHRQSAGFDHHFDAPDFPKEYGFDYEAPALTFALKKQAQANHKWVADSTQDKGQTLRNQDAK